MEPWTRAQREAFVNLAITSENYRGYNGPYHFHRFQKKKPIDEEDVKRVALTNVLANVLFKNPMFRIISLNFHDLLIQKINNNIFLNQYTQDIVIVLKGSNAYAFALYEKKTTSFHFLILILAFSSIHFSPLNSLTK